MLLAADASNKRRGRAGGKGKDQTGRACASSPLSTRSELASPSRDRRVWGLNSSSGPRRGCAHHQGANRPHARTLAAGSSRRSTAAPPARCSRAVRCWCCWRGRCQSVAARTSHSALRTPRLSAIWRPAASSKTPPTSGPARPSGNPAASLQRHT